MVNRIYPSELRLNKTNVSDAEVSFLDLHLSISDGFVKTKIYDKRDDFEGYRYHKLRKAFSKFYWRHFDILSKYNVRLKTLLLQGLSEPEVFEEPRQNLNFMATWCTNSEK